MTDVRIATVEPGSMLDAVHAEILTPSFPPSELSSVDGLRAGIAAGDTSVLAAFDDDDRPVAVAVGDWSPPHRVALLSYLAVRPGVRASGLGGRVLAYALADWRERWRPALMLAEIEHPAVHPATESYGDPAARVRFYGRFDLRPLGLPYFQPALRPGQPRAYGLMLCVFSPESSTVDGEILRPWFVEYLLGTEGAVGDDPATTALLAAMAADVRVLSFERLDEVPISRAP